ncbi:uncharacterized protein LOC110102180 [Dendrobium catenatum]|uniref:Uncharacterized protein n=1 Tax=Dendrobium catenatum TaxID=906689 RepID=A0A2I0XC06_9ASPA|nr:uncharacterized protein LOC110102180 [Dendrobium catenatum]PKU85426.1 hypothetical protein MA16_Dca003165 [Dendrobium catenatum]
MEIISHIHHIARSFTLVVLFLAWNCKAETPSGYSNAARQLDLLLQDYAYRAFDRPHTGIPYDGAVPSNLTGIKVAVLRLRCGSLRTRGFHRYKEFDIPTGVIVQPYVKRLAFVYQNLGNWSSFYYPLQGYTYLAPVLGLLAYSAANLSAIGLSELDIMASSSPISIKFNDVNPVPSVIPAKCVKFHLNGTIEFTDLISGNVCMTFRQGHFSIVVNSSGIVLSPAPAPTPIPSHGKGHKSKVWKIVVSVVGGLVGLLLLILLVAWLASYRKKKKLAEMQRREEVGEVLQMGLVGNTRIPVAPMTRTKPAIENDYVP